MSEALCVRCEKPWANWLVHQAEFSVARVRCWKVQLCEACSNHVERQLLEALKKPEAKP